MSASVDFEMLLDALADAIADRLAVRTQATVANVPVAPPQTSDNPGDWMDTRSAAKYIAHSVQTLEHWRMRGDVGPTWAKVGTRVRYKRADLDKFMAERMRGQPKPEAQRTGKRAST